jgi:hypothetical protein
MVDVPAVFNRPDFLGALLPGYIAVILIVIFFFPKIIPMQDGEQAKGLALDFFSAIVFIVAGPAVGYTLRQLHRTFYTLMGTRDKKVRKAAVEQYYALRIALNDSEKSELDMSEAAYDFNISTGLVLLAFGLYSIVKFGPIPEWNNIPLIVASIVCFIGGYIERSEGFTPLYTKLVLKYRAQ